MNCCGISINLLSTLLLLLENVVATEVNNRVNMASVNSVRCRVRCLTLLQRSLELEEAAVTLVGCLKEPQCEACLRPCSQNHMSTDFCEDACRQPEHDGACKESCQFLKQVNNIKSGRCPPETQVIGEAAMCVKACHNDADCQGVLKCCSNSCGWTCQRPTHMFDGFPEIPHRPIIKERSRPSLSSLASSSSSSSPSLLELKWNSVAQSNSTEQILYIVESRWSIGEQPDEENMRNWTQITQTTETSASVEVMAGHWYQYRVTAVNIYGSRGGSEPSKTFSLSKAPRKPSPPVNFTEGDTFITGGKVSVIVHWLPPARSDLPISRYKLFWSNRPRNSPSNVMEFRQVVPGDQLNFQIPDLLPKTTYFVQIQAICQYGEGKLKSDKVGLQITTYPMEVHYGANDMHHQTLQSSNGFRSMPTPSSPIGVVVDRPVYHHGNLKANVSWEFSPALLGTPRADKVALYWSPEACIADHSQDESLSKIMSATTQNSSYTIHDLRFDCRYLIRIQPTTNHGILGTMGRLTLNTPSCYDVIVVGKQRPDCPNGDVRQADEPLNLQHSFYISRSNITARISWEHPYYGSPSSSSSSSSSSSIGYRIVWGPSGGSEASPSLTKVLPGDVTSHTLTNLKEGTTYSVKVQMLYKYGPSKPATILFTTPLLQQQQIIDSVDSYDGEEGEEDDDAEEIVNEEEEEEEDDEGVDNNYAVNPVRQHRRNNNNNQPRFDWQEASIWHTSDNDMMASSGAGAGPAAEAHQPQLSLLLPLLVASSVLYGLCS